MAIILFRNAIVALNGAILTGSLHDLTLDYGAEVLDGTRMGDDTRRKVAGLFMGKIAGKGYFDGAVDFEPILFRGIGDASSLVLNPAYQSAVEIEDSLFVIFPDGLTEGATTTGMGYALKGVLTTFTLGGTVGTLLDIAFAAESRGVAA